MRNEERNGDTPIRFLGLDFGTSYSFLACQREDEDEDEAIILLSGEEMSRVACGIPSLLWVKGKKDGEKEIIIGQKAVSAQQNDAGNVVKSVKMKLTQANPFVLNGLSLTAQEIARKIIAYLFELAQSAAPEYYLTFTDPSEVTLVMGVPIKFGTYQRELLCQTVRQLGYEVELLPEPMAAALYHASKVGRHFSKALVCDVGAGTFDVAFLTDNPRPTAHNPYPYKCLDCDGTTNAGDKIDELLANYILAHKADDWSPVQIAKARDPKTVDHQRFLNKARQLKEALSEQEEAEDYVTIDSQPARLHVTQEDLEEAARPVIDEIADRCYQLVKKVGMLERNFEIVMVGGSSNSPMIGDILRKTFPQQANTVKRRSPSQAVVKGCALYARQKTLGRKVNYAYAIEYYDVDQKKRRLSIEIPAGVTLPYSAENHFVTRYESQQSVEFRIYEVPEVRELGSVDIEDGYYNEIKVVHRFTQPVPQHTKVICNLELTESGILKVSVYDNGITGGATRKEFHMGLEMESAKNKKGRTDT